MPGARTTRRAPPPTQPRLHPARQPAAEPGWRRCSVRQQQAGPASPPKLLYVTNFLSAAEFSAVTKECAQLRPKIKEEVDCLAVNRRGCVVPRSSSIRRIFSRQASRLSAAVGRPLHLSDLPIEMRAYPVGAQMNWHVDDCLYAEPQYELIYTVTNTSDSFTEWRDERACSHKEWTQPNSLLVVQAAGYNHRVTPIRKGERTILKMVMATTRETLPLYHEYLGREAFKKR